MTSLSCIFWIINTKCTFKVRTFAFAYDVSIIEFSCPNAMQYAIHLHLHLSAGYLTRKLLNVHTWIYVYAFFLQQCFAKKNKKLLCKILSTGQSVSSSFDKSIIINFWLVKLHCTSFTVTDYKRDVMHSLNFIGPANCSVDL